MTPVYPKPPPRNRPGRRRDYLPRKHEKIRRLWRLTYLDADFGQCFEWAPTLHAAKAMRLALIEHYSHDIAHTGPPEVFIGSVLIPTKTREDLAAWLSLHLTCAPRRLATARDADPATPDAQTMTPVNEN